MSLTLARWRMAVAAGAVVVMTACTALPPAERSVPDRFADAYIELLPVAALMDHAAKQDPSWPLGAKAALVSEAQLGCMRRALLPTEVEAAQRKTARDYAQAHPDTLATDLAVLKRMADDAEAMELAGDAAHVRRLWSACSLPDFLKAGPEAHGRMVARLWRDKGQGNGHIDADWFAGQMGTLFPVFFVSTDTVAMQVGAALTVGVVAALIPAWRAAHVRIVDGLRAVA